jgi:hypothetical protein
VLPLAPPEPGVFFKDSNGTLVKVGPTFVGTTAPNSTPGSGGASGNTLGEQWLDTSGTNPVLKIWDGSAWQSEAGEFVNVSGDTMTGALVMDNQQQIRFRETTANGTNYIALQAPASVAFDKTITLPDVTGTVVTTGDTGSVTSTMILDGTIVNGDVNASAAIAGTKISPDFGSQTVQTTGVFSAAGGAAATPSITFTGDLNTGIYSPGADQLAISSSGSERIRIGANGEIGIGGANYGTSGQVLTSGGTGAAPSWTTLTVNTDKIEEGNSSAEVIDTGSDGRFVVTTEGSERLRIDSSGRLGLGTSSPATLLEINSTTTNAARLRVTGTGTTAGNFRGYEFGNGSVFKGGLLQDESTDLISIFTPVGGQSVNITSAGRVGIGTTSPSTPLHVKGDDGIRIENVSLSRAYQLLAYTGGGSPNANFRIYDATAGADRLNIDTSGRVLVGTSSSRSVGITGTLQIEKAVGGTDSPGISITNSDNSGWTSYLNLAKTRSGSVGTFGAVLNNDALGAVGFWGSSSSSLIAGAEISALVDGANISISSMPTRLVFSTTADGASSPTERMRIASNGHIYTGAASPGAAAFGFSINRVGQQGLLECYRNVGNNSQTAIIGGNAGEAYIEGDGDLKNTNNSYGAISDIKLKENIVDASSQWDDLKALQVRNYNFKPETGYNTHTQIGLVAQEVEAVCPGLVGETPDRDADGNDLGTVTKSVNYSVLYMKAVKALQEAMERIEQLEAKVAALEAA